MNKRFIEDLIPIAIEYISKNKVKILKDNELPKQFNGYISSFGVSISQAGLRQSILFFQDDGGAEEKRSEIIKLILYLLQHEKSNKYIAESYTKLYDFVNKDENNTIRTKELILDTVIAIKLSFKAFKKKEK